MIYLNSTLWYQLIGTKRNPWIAVYLQSPTSYSQYTSTLLLSFQLCYKPLGLFQTVNNKRYTYCIKLLLSIFNSSVKKLSNLESSFLLTDTSWKKTLKISTQTFRMVANLSKTFLHTQSFFIAWNQKEMLFALGKTRSREKKLLNFKRSSKTFTQDTKPISNYIYPL